MVQRECSTQLLQNGLQVSYSLILMYNFCKLKFHTCMYNYFNCNTLHGKLSLLFANLLLHAHVTS